MRWFLQTKFSEIILNKLDRAFKALEKIMTSAKFLKRSVTCFCFNPAHTAPISHSIIIILFSI